MSVFNKVCTEVGKCLGIAAQVGNTVTAHLPVISNISNIISSLNEKHINYDMLKTDIPLTKALIDHFNTALDTIEELQTTTHIEICAVSTGRRLQKELDNIVSWFAEGKITEAQQKITADWYRSELLRYTTYIHAYLSHIQLATMDIRQRHERITAMKDATPREALLKQLTNQYKCPLLPALDFAKNPTLSSAEPPNPKDGPLRWIPPM
jgi:hypothetical protein